MPKQTRSRPVSSGVGGGAGFRFSEVRAVEISSRCNLFELFLHCQPITPVDIFCFSSTTPSIERNTMPITQCPPRTKMAARQFLFRLRVSRPVY